MSWNQQDEEQGWQQQTNEALEHDLCEALDRCQQQGASLDDLRLISWQCGVQWTPKQHSRQNSSSGLTLTNAKNGD